MPGSSYRPWRRDPDAADILEPEATSQWRDLLSQTQRGIADLRDLNSDIDEKLGCGHRLIETLDRQTSRLNEDAVTLRRMEKIEARLALLERAVGQLTAHMPARSSSNEKTSTVEPFEHLLGSIRSDAA